MDDFTKDVGPVGNYGRSKLANLLYARYLATHLTKKYPKILSNATHPGIVDTKQTLEDIHEPYPLGGYAMSVGLKPFRKDQFEGALPSLFNATKTENSGEYICPPAMAEDGSPQSRDVVIMENLMKWTDKIVKEKTKSESADKGCPFNDF
jgi:hypothetical protein